ncbi:hypothetical protein [Kordia zhangzhouensis]|uniref:hypothetical protein n=1 Tax=Kordia zhangzhouensis TaxID=1620405 RepID=UPI000629384D|nr:hypothetical protein [Kordia zhangzhouensis]
MNHIKTIPQAIYTIKNAHVYLLETKTNVCYDEELELVIIDNTRLSESLSMRFKYTLGSLSFLFEEVSKKVSDLSEKNRLRDRIVHLFENLQDELGVITSESHVERLIDFLNSEKNKIKSAIPNYL